METRKQIWDVHIRSANDGKKHRLNIPLDDDVDTFALAERFNFVGREIRNAVISACISAAMKDKEKVSQDDFLQACEKIVKEKASLAAAKDHTSDTRAQEAVKKALIDKLNGGTDNVFENAE